MTTEARPNQASVGGYVQYDIWSDLTSYCSCRLWRLGKRRPCPHIYRARREYEEAAEKENKK